MNNMGQQNMSNVQWTSSHLSNRCVTLSVRRDFLKQIHSKILDSYQENYSYFEENIAQNE